MPHASPTKLFTSPPSKRWTRGSLLGAGLALAAPLALAACGAKVAASGVSGARPAGKPAQLAQTPASDDGDELTPAQTEGPYFKPNSPERASLLTPGVTGSTLILAGRVLAVDGQPVARALLDFWQADPRGTYDNSGYTLRGHQFADDAGQYRLETVVPGLYPGRTRHIHVKVQAPNGPVLTTQLYFPDEPRNATDSIFDPRLVLPAQNTDAGLSATFDFVIAT